jgi:hypothetical protein
MVFACPILFAKRGGNGFEGHMVMRNVLVMCAFFALTGCILPPVLSYASMALDGVSYVATGKSVTDHALSAAVKQDCAVWRVVSEQDVEAVCQEYVGGDAGGGFAVAFKAGGAAPPTGRHQGQPAPPAEIVLAAATPVELFVTVARPPVASATTPAEPPVELLVTAGPPVELFVTAAGPPAELAITAAGPPVALAITPAEPLVELYGAPAAPPPVKLAITAVPEPLNLLLRIEPAKLPANPDSAAQPAATQGVPAATNRKAIYLVVGSFRTVDRAERLAAQMPGITAAIAPALVGGDRYYRVVVGPYEPGETGDALLRLAAVGIGDSWAANLCTGDLGAPPCGTSP